METDASHEGPKDLATLLEEQARLERLYIKARTGRKLKQAETIRKELDAVNNQLRIFYREEKGDQK